MQELEQLFSSPKASDSSSEPPNMSFTCYLSGHKDFSARPTSDHQKQGCLHIEAILNSPIVLLFQMMENIIPGNINSFIMWPED